MTALVKPPAALKRRKLSSNQWQQPNTALGQVGENQVVNFLISKNYLIQAQNVLFSSGEIDIVAFDSSEEELVFVEVKTRTHDHFGHPSQALGKKKLKALKSAAIQYLQNYPSVYPIRFDLVIVLRGKITHYQNVTM